MDKKPFWKSKTLWVNIIALLAIIAQAVTGEEIIPAETQTGILGVLNVVLRGITKTAVGIK